MPARPETVRSYSLYGEAGHLPDVMHCETIAERSVLHDWELAPHRHDRLHQLLLMRSGGGMARLDHDELALAPASLVNVPIGTVHAFAFEPGTQGWVITLADVVLDDVGFAQRALDISHSQPVGRELGRLDVDAHRGLAFTEDAQIRRAGQHQQAWFDDAVHRVRELQ